MADPPETPAEAKRRRRRWINLGEAIGIGALAISALGLWNSWSKDDKIAVAVEKSRSVPFALRGRIEDGGKRMIFAPVDAGHALETLSLTTPDKATVDLGSSPELSASTVEGLLRNPRKDGTGSLRVTLTARYIETGAEQRSSGRYWLGYRWVGGGLFGGHSLRLTSMTRG